MDNVSDFVGAFLFLIISGLVLLIILIGLVSFLVNVALEWRAIQREGRRERRQRQRDIDNLQRRWRTAHEILETPAPTTRKTYEQI